MTPTVIGNEPLRSTRFVGVVWALLFINTLSYTSGSTVIPFPKSVAQVITMGALACALGLALAINPRICIRPNAYLCFLTLLVVVSILGSLGMQSGTGAFLRCGRLLVLVLVLWILSGWWQGDMRFVRYHFYMVAFTLLSVVVGLIIKPGGAFSGEDGRLSGTIWPIPPTQVAHYGAIATGLALIMWITQKLDGRSAAIIGFTAALVVVLSRTRTGMLGLAVGLAVCGVALSLNHARARRFFAGVLVVGAAVALLLGPTVATWLTRGQDAESLANFTGRAKVWDQLVDQPRTPVELAVGIGLTDKSYNGLPIDSSWYAVYHEQGWAGLLLVTGFLLALLMAILLRPLNPERTCALFLVVYCLCASYTEVGLGDASPYLLELAVATSLTVAPTRRPAGEVAASRRSTAEQLPAQRR
jgi:hypothetical protein